MKQEIYGIKDKAIGFTEIFTAHSKYEALRAMSQAVNNPQRTIVTEHPKDFSLFKLGELEIESGLVTPKNEFIEELNNLSNKGGKTK